MAWRLDGVAQFGELVDDVVHVGVRMRCVVEV